MGFDRLKSCKRQRLPVNSITGRITHPLRLLLLTTAAIVFFVPEAIGQSAGDYGSAAAGPANWTAAGSWVVCVTDGTWAGATAAPAAPAAGNNVWIRNGHTITMNANPGSCNNLTIEGILNSLANRSLNVAGNINCSGTLNFSTNGSGITAGGNMTSSGIITFGSGILTINGTTSLTGGSFTDQSNNGVNTFAGAITLSNDATWTTTAVTTAANLLIQSGFTHSVGSTGTVGMGAATITGNLLNAGGAFQKSANGFFSVSSATTISGGSFTISNNNNPCTFAGAITLSNDATWTSTAVTNAANLVIQNGIVHNSTEIFSAGAATFNTTSGQSLEVNSTGNMDFGAGNSNLAVNVNLLIRQNGSGTFNYTGTGTLAIANNVTLTNEATVNASGRINGGNAASTWLNEANATLNYSNTNTLMGTGILTAAASENTVNYSGTGAQTIKAANYYHLTSSSTGARTLPNTGTVGISGVFTPGTNAYTIANSTINFNGTENQEVPAFNYFNLALSGARGAGNITLAGGGTIGVAGAFSPTASFSTGGYIVAGNTLQFNSTTAQTIPAFNYNNLTSSSTGARTLSSTGTIGIAGVFTPGTNTYTIANSTVNFNGLGDQPLASFTYNNLTIDGGGTKNLQGNVTVNSVLSLANGNLSLGGANYNLTIQTTGTISGSFDNTRMIVCDGSGSLIRRGSNASAFVMTYPLGTGTMYTPMQITSMTATLAGTETLSVRAVAGVAPNANPTDLNKYWVVTKSAGLTGISANVNFTYDPAEVNGNEAFYQPGFYTTSWQTVPGPSSAGSNPFSATGTNLTGAATTTANWTSLEGRKTLYSYQTGDWNDLDTWTSDPGGTTLIGSAVPENEDKVVILSGRTVSLSGNIVTSDLEIAINEGGILNLSTFAFANPVSTLSGEGTIRLASASFPTATNNLFVQAGGGTTEFYNSSGFDFPAAQSQYNHLHLSAPGITATLLSNLTINGNLQIKQGTFRINDNSNARRQLTIMGDVTVNSGASISVGKGVTNPGTGVTGITGGTAPFINYYDAYSHRVVVYGNFTNNGTVRFTNLSYPVYNAFPPVTTGATTGFATVYFMGATSNTLTCNGITDFYNLVLDKGVDQTFSLTVYASAYSNFRLFGANSSGGDSPGNNPNLKKALWIRTGTLELEGLVIIPSLSEGTCDGNPNSDFYVPANGALVLNGPDVVVLSTADDYREINAAYGVAAPSNGAIGIGTGGCSSFSILGKLKINDGYFSTRESGGFITWDWASGQFEINGGTVDAKQFRAAGGAGGLASFQQTGGVLELRGRFQRTPAAYTSISDLTEAPLNIVRTTNGINGAFGTLNINAPANVFAMSGGTVRIFDVCGANGYAVDIFSSPSNINVTGGTFDLIPTSGSNPASDYNYLIRSLAPFGHFNVNRTSGSTQVLLGSSYPLTVLGNLVLTSGFLDAANQNVSVGGNFTVDASATYNSGTNTTLLNGTANQTFTINGTINNGAAGLSNLSVGNTTGIVQLAGSQPTIVVQGNFSMAGGTIDDGGKTISVAGNVIHSGSHISTPGNGSFSLNGVNAQTIDGDGTGTFHHLRLDNTNSATAPVSLLADLTLTGTLTFDQDKLLNIAGHNLKLMQNADIANAGSGRFIQTSGQAGDGGLTRVYNSTSALLFPLGAPSTRHASAAYTPASIGFGSAPAAFGSITVIPVGYEHPNTIIKGRSLTYFWRVLSAGFTLGSGTVNHAYTYSDADIVTGSGITEDRYIAAKYNGTTSSWQTGTTDDVDETVNLIGEPGSGAFLQEVSFIDGEYSAGDQNPSDPFGNPTVFYSRQSGPWSNVNTWSLSGHTVDNVPATVPGASDIVIIGDADSVFLATNNNTANTGVQNGASLQIEAGAALDIGYNPGCNFGIVRSHPNGNGNFRLTTRYNSPFTFGFPAGDFSDFNQNLGTTELYTTNPTSGTTYYLPNGITTYGNLIISPLGGSNIIFPNHNLTVFGNLITRGENADSWFCPTWDVNYPTAPATRIAKTITIEGDMRIMGGALVWYGNGAIRQDVVVNGDVLVAPLAAIDVWSGATSQSLSIGGSLINNTTNTAPVSTPSRCDFTLLPVTFFGSGNASITNTAGTPMTIIEQLTVNKGNSQTTTLTIDIAGTLNTPVNNWLTIQNGTIRYSRTGNLNITTTGTLIVPGTAGLEINTPSSVYIANSNSNTNDLYLSGKLTLVNGTVYIGPSAAPANNNDIEYSGGGLSEIDIRGGTLVVNGQIRRNPATASGILKYRQSSGTVVINGNAANTSNAKLEVLNTGSSFNMTGGSITIVRGGGGPTYGDLYLRPENGSVTGGDIVFSQWPAGFAGADADQTYTLDATTPLNNITITGKTTGTARNATTRLLISPLSLNGNLTLTNARSIFDANATYSINVNIKGNLSNNGTYNFYSNHTTFNGNIQSILGSSITNFFDLTVNPITSLTLIRDVTVNNNLVLSSGQLLASTFNINLKGDLTNNANYDGDPAVGGIILNGTVTQNIAGSGTFGRLELNNNLGARLQNSINLQKNLRLTNGILDISQYLLTLGQNSNIEGAPFGAGKMITPDGVFSNIGIRKYFNTGSSNFTFPLGMAGKYTPAELVITASATVGYIRVNAINDRHPAVVDPANVLDYFWELESSGISGFAGSIVFTYNQSDVQGSFENDYVAARLIVPGTSWSKATPGPATDNVNETTNQISFTFSPGTNNLNGEYTAGTDAAIPAEVSAYESNANGNWTDNLIWTPVGSAPPCPAGGPNGFIVVVNHEVTTNTNHCFSYRTTINNKLRIVSPTYGHNLGTIEGNGTLYLESGSLPAGRYTTFFDCASNSTVEFGGSGNYAVIADLFNSLPKMHATGSGTRTLPNKDLTICQQLLINGPLLDNSVNNRKLTIQGTLERYGTGSFLSGSGSGATVSFSGNASQQLGGPTGNFTGANAFNNLEINNGAGLALNGPQEINGNLLLTAGNIATSSSNSLTVTNTSSNCIIPAGGSSASYVNGPMTKRMNQGDQFVFPIGKGVNLGNKVTVLATQTGTLDWTVEYFNPNTFTTLQSPLSAANLKENWLVGTASGNRARISLRWDPQSDLTPLMTQNGLTDMRVARYNGSDWVELASSATGDNSNGSVSSNSRVNFGASPERFTIACINTVKPKATLSPNGPVCGDTGIPVTFTSPEPTLPYTLDYTVDGIAQLPVVVNSLPYILPTAAGGGTYRLTGFAYNGGTGVVDPGNVSGYPVPTSANAGADQTGISLCGATSAILDANTPVTGTGLWSIASGTGGTVITPGSPTSIFNGINGSSYTLRWTISSGTCISADEMTVVFPILPAVPSAFTSSQSTVCQNQTGVSYSVLNDPTVTYTWTYSGTGATINGSTNSVSIDFDATATDGTLSVTATNGCGTSAARTLNIAVNPLPVQPAAFTQSTSSLCAGSSAIPYTIPNDPSVTYTWTYSGTGATINGSGNAVNVDFADDASSGDLAVTATNGCGTSSARSIELTLYSLPAISITGNQVACTGATELYETELGMSGYIWTVTGGTIDAGGTANDPTVTVTWTTIGNQSVEVNYTNGNGCSASAPLILPVTIYKQPETGPSFYIPNNFAP